MHGENTKKENEKKSKPVLFGLPSSSRRALGVVTPDSIAITSFISLKQIIKF
jgi:hypothetical protein